MGVSAKLLPCRTRLHLHHGPIDLIIGAEGERQTAFEAARARFETILEELVAELPFLKTPIGPDTPWPSGAVARRMNAAARPMTQTYLTPMVAVAGAVADEVLDAMLGAASPNRAYVNNGGDIALHLGRGESFSLSMAQHDGTDLGRIAVASGAGIGGIATSGRHGRSMSLGIADSVTVLAKNAALADTTATLIANAVDLPGHPSVQRRLAEDLHQDTDLAGLHVTTGCARLSHADTDTALAAGERLAVGLLQQGHITAAALFLGDQCRLVGDEMHFPQTRRLAEHA